MLWTGLSCLEDLWPNATWTVVFVAPVRDGLRVLQRRAVECEEPGSSRGLKGAIKDLHWGWLWEKAISDAEILRISPESACSNSAKESVLFSVGSQGQELQP